MMCSTTDEKGDLVLIYLNMIFNMFLSLPKDVYGNKIF